MQRTCTMKQEISRRTVAITKGLLNVSDPRNIARLLIVLIGISVMAFHGCAEWRYQKYSDTAEAYSQLALHGDSVALMRSSTRSQPVSRMLLMVENEPGLVKAMSERLTPIAGSSSADTAIIHFNVDYNGVREEVAFWFVQVSDTTWLVHVVTFPSKL